jgi:hypothetical protein
MTNKEALEKWKRVLNNNPSDKSKELLEVTIQSLEKQEPTLVKGIGFTYDGSVGNCPSCDSFVDDRHNLTICKCGQKLLWKEVQDDK